MWFPFGRRRPPTRAERRRRQRSKRHRRSGFTLIELLIVAVIIGILASLAMPMLGRVRDRAAIAKAIGDVRAIGQDIEEYMLTNGALPSNLAAVGRAGLLDPYGNPYQYLPIIGSGKGGFRKDRFLVPINSDFDLYSMGADGKTAGPLTAKASHDDIIRANDGGFVGLATQF